MSEDSAIKAQNERKDRAEYEGQILLAIKECWMADSTDTMEQYVEAVKNFLDDVAFEEIKGDINFKTRKEFEGQIDWNMIPPWYNPKQQGSLYVQQLLLLIYYDAHRVFKDLVNAHKARGLLLNLGDTNKSPYDVTAKVRSKKPDDSAVPGLMAK